jgi:acyl-CoA dehydrogenase
MTTDPFDYAELDAGRGCNYWTLDRTLQFEVRRVYDDEEYEWAETRLAELGRVVGETVADDADVVDRHGPRLHTYDDRGEVANEVEYHPAQFENERIAFESGTVADAFHAPPGREEPMGLVHPLVMQTLLCYADVGLVCSVSMTAGAALVLDRHGDDSDGGPLDEYFEALTARDYEDVIQGAMFLTEKQGGSDVGANETVAERAEDGADDAWRVTGEKWFCSNIDAEGTLVLARRPDAPGGTGGLSLFLVPHTRADGTLNDAVYRRLKDKLGTRSVPTGEVEFRGAEAYLVGEPERGFTYMTTMLNYERVTNATGAVGVMGRALLESKVHAANREAFGRTLDDHPLMRRDLVEMAVEYEAAAAFSFEAARQFDRWERSGRADEEAFQLMRLLVPIAKYRTARMAVETTSYAMEIRGGDGYVEDYVTHRLLRDAQVLPIWEGASNVLSLDVLRALDREDAHEALLPAIRERLDATEHPALIDLAETVREEFHALQEALVALATADPERAQLEAKEFADLVFDVVTASILLEEAGTAIDRDDDGRKALVAAWWVRETLADRPARGITDGNRLPLDAFDAIVRYASVAPGEVEALLAEE